MTKQEVLNIIKQGEGRKTEFKESKNKLPNNLFETVCAFLNTVGGTILLGVADNGKIIGLDNNTTTKLKKDIANQSNNSQKLEPVFMLYAQEFEIDKKQILVIKVPESSMVHKTNNTVFARNEDGDYKLTHLEKIAEIVNRKKNYFSEQTVYPNVKFDDFDINLIKRAKNLIKINNNEHHWLELDDKEFLSRAGFYKKSNNGDEGYTLAGILFFGTDKLIQSIVPAYKFEALVRKFNVDRYDDRLTVRTNLIDAYDLLMGFIEKHVNDPFYLEGTTRISLRSKIFRELVANIIAHREYLNASPAVITIFKNKIEFKNPNNPKQYGIIDPKHFTPYAKNPTISKFMLQLGRVEEVGSGMKNVYKYLPAFSKNGKSKFLDGEFFTTTIYLASSDKTNIETSKISWEKTKNRLEENKNQIIEWIDKNKNLNIRALVEDKLDNNQIDLLISLVESKDKLGRKHPQKLVENFYKIIALILTDNIITIKKIAQHLNLSTTAIDNQINKLKKTGLLKRIGPDKGGHWKIIDNKTQVK